MEVQTLRMISNRTFSATFAPLHQILASRWQIFQSARKSGSGHPNVGLLTVSSAGFLAIAGLVGSSVQVQLCQV